MNEGASRRVTYARREGVVGGPEVKARRNLWLRLTEPAASISDDVERRRALGNVEVSVWLSLEATPMSSDDDGGPLGRGDAVGVR